jgi:peptidoglycan/xylan/chitin deacetylase (PgdA/CDA1 family)
MKNKLKFGGKALRMFLLILSALFVFILGVLYLQPKVVLTWLSAQNPDVLYFVNTDIKVVALTIDDAPHAAVTPLLLDVLKKYSAHATFFVIGGNIPGNENLVDRMRREGHEIGNHLAKDFPSIFLDKKEFEDQLVRVDKLINPGSANKWFRPGSAFYTAGMIKLAKKCSYRCCLGSVYPFDIVFRKASIISKFIISRVFPGAIILIHDGKPDRIRSVEVLKTVLPELIREGYKVVTLSELISITK